MKHSRVAQRYAQAWLQASVEAKEEETVAKDLEFVRNTVNDSNDLRMLLKSPVIKQDKKRDVLKAVFEGKISGMTLGFLDLVAEKGREPALTEILTRFFELRHERLGLLHVSVTAGTDLSGDQQSALQKRFADLTKKTITMDVTVDRSLRGGFLARVGDTVFDGSIRRQLEIMRQRLLKGDGSN